MLNIGKALYFLIIIISVNAAGKVRSGFGLGARPLSGSVCVTRTCLEARRREGEENRKCG